MIHLPYSHSEYVAILQRTSHFCYDEAMQSDTNLMYLYFILYRVSDMYTPNFTSRQTSYEKPKPEDRRMVRANTVAFGMGSPKKQSKKTSLLRWCQFVTREYDVSRQMHQFSTILNSIAAVTTWTLMHLSYMLYPYRMFVLITLERVFPVVWLSVPFSITSSRRRFHIIHSSMPTG